MGTEFLVGRQRSFLFFAVTIQFLLGGLRPVGTEIATYFKFPPLIKYNQHADYLPLGLEYGVISNYSIINSNSGQSGRR